MAQLGLFLSSEEHSPPKLVAQARHAEEAGIDAILISDHYHPWVDRQGQSGFVWSVIGAIAASTRQKVTTGVTCPTVRIHPAILAQATATSQLLLDGKFAFGVGSGEALNEHILGDRWPPAPTRLAMLEEAIDVIRRLWEGGSVTHHGRYYQVENARLYSLPEKPPAILVSAFGPKATEVAARIGDGLVQTKPEAAALERYRRQGGKGPAVGALKVCWSEDEAQARRLAHEVWASDFLPGELNQELPTPAHFEQASSLVQEEQVAESVPCGPDPERYVEAVTSYFEAGFDELYLNQIGDDQDGFLSFYRKELQPRLAPHLS